MARWAGKTPPSAALNPPNRGDFFCLAAGPVLRPGSSFSLSSGVLIEVLSAGPRAEAANLLQNSCRLNLNQFSKLVGKTIDSY